MPKPRAPKLETPTARLKLAIRRKPYWQTISPGIALGYRRNVGVGTWNGRCYSAGEEWIKRVADANDYEAADGERILDYWQAIERIRALVREATGTGSGDRPITVREALDRYQADLKSRGANAYNAGVVRLHLAPALAERLVGALTANELVRWRDRLLAAGMLPATFNRTKKGLAAALTLAAARDPRITNSRAWKIGLKSLPDTHSPRNVILSAAEVARVVQEAYAIDHRFGRYVETLALTGARPSQADRLTTADLLTDRVMMPTSKKGRGRKTIAHYPVPIPHTFVVVLATEAAGRPAGAPLLLDPSGKGWSKSPQRREMFRRAVTAAGLDPDHGTPYCLRHTSITRMLKAGVPTRVVAGHHDTSVVMIERTYSVHITSHTDALIRNTLPDLSPPPSDSVVIPLPVGRVS